MDSEDHAIILSLHHIVTDGWSMATLLSELMEAYEAFAHQRTLAMRPVKIQYADFAYWQRNWLQGEVLEKQIEYWKRRLEGAPSSLDLRTDYPRPAEQNFRGRRRNALIAQGMTDDLRILCRQEGVTLFTFLLAVFKVFLRYYAATDDLVVGTNVANRNRLEVEGIIGFFVNQLVLRTDAGGDPSFREFLRQVHEVVLGAYTHEDMPFERLVAELSPERDAGHSPLYQVLFTLQPPLREPRMPEGLVLQKIAIPSTTARFDLVLALADAGSHLSASIEYNSELYHESSVERMLLQYESLLRMIAIQPDIRFSALQKNLAAVEGQHRAAKAGAFRTADRESLKLLKKQRSREQAETQAQPAVLSVTVQ
jgi:non-ribosomal peptide synthetase component F